MKIFKKYSICGIFTLTFLGLLSSCGTAGERAEVTETADQIEEAHIAGREAARTFVNKNWSDSLQLQEQLVEAGARRAVYDSLPKCRAAYDSAFISTVRTVRPEVARQLENYK